MFYKKAILVLLVFIGLLSRLAFAQEQDGLAMMDRMIKSFSELSYEGVFVRSHGSEMNSMQIRHTVINGIEYESLVDLDGARIEVIRVGDSVICVYPNISFSNNTDPVIAPFQKFRELNSERISQGYDLVVADQGLVAGRRAQKLELKPKDNYRFPHHFWLDVETGFLLKHDTLKNISEVLERVQFTSLNTSPNLYKKDFVPKMGAYTEHIARRDHEIIDSEWIFGWLPPGFTPVWDGARQMDDKASMMLVSDGITSISVFTEPSNQERSLSITKMGATIAGEQTHVMNGSLYLVTAVGEVPDRTIRKLLTMVVPRQGQ